MAKNDFNNYRCALCNNSKHGSSWPRCRVRQEKLNATRDVRHGPAPAQPAPTKKLGNPPPQFKPPTDYNLTNPAWDPIQMGMIKASIQANYFVMKTFFANSINISQWLELVSAAYETHLNIKVGFNLQTEDITIQPTGPLISPRNSVTS